jgi:hypothetical protein
MATRMNDGVARLKCGETWLCLLAWCVVPALLVWHGFSAVTIGTSLIASVYSVVLCKCAPGSRVRLVAGYFLVWAGYLGSAVLVQAMRVPVRSAELLALDRVIFGETPAVLLSTFRARWVGEFLSLGYLSYMVYLHVALLSALMADARTRARWMHVAWGTFAVGFVGYLAFPASSPNRVFPELFAQPIAGGVITRTNEAINAAASAQYDAFPSLHVLITLTLLRMDWSENRRRFWVMLGPSLIMVVSTLALRLHYAVDLLASVILFVMLCVFWRRERATL